MGFSMVTVSMLWSDSHLTTVGGSIIYFNKYIEILYNNVQSEKYSVNVLLA